MARLSEIDYQALLERVVREVEPLLGKGKVANYIPALAAVDPRKFGIAVTTLDGHTYCAGDASEVFSIQSISKVFTLTMALQVVGDQLWKRVGREPSGTPFNSLVQLEYEQGIPRNPLINAGALVVTDAVVENTHGRRPIDAILAFMRECADDDSVEINDEVARSEKQWGNRNAALANLIKAFGNLKSPVETVLDTYFHQCALAMNCRQLSRAVLYLANAGKCPLTGRTFVSKERARRINAIMLTCGHYDSSGDFAFRVGLPAKSGVGGGIVAVVPGKLGICVWSPALSPQGNSLVGTIALERLAGATGESIFG